VFSPVGDLSKIYVTEGLGIIIWCHLGIQSEVKPEPILTSSHTYSYTRRHYSIFAQFLTYLFPPRKGRGLASSYKVASTSDPTFPALASATRICFKIWLVHWVLRLFGLASQEMENHSSQQSLNLFPNSLTGLRLSIKARPAAGPRLICMWMKSHFHLKW